MAEEVIDLPGQLALADNLHVRIRTEEPDRDGVTTMPFAERHNRLIRCQRYGNPLPSAEVQEPRVDLSAVRDEDERQGAITVCDGTGRVDGLSRHEQQSPMDRGATGHAASWTSVI